MKKFLLSSLFLLVLITVVCSFAAKQVNARIVLPSDSREQPWTCGTVKVWSPNDYKWSKPQEKSWYQIQSCIMEDAQGNVISKTTAYHSSGPVYAGRCRIRTEALNYNPNGYRDYNWWDAEGDLKPMNCGESQTTRKVVSPSKYQFVIGQEYFSYG